MWVIEEGELECFKKIGDEDRFLLPRGSIVFPFLNDLIGYMNPIKELLWSLWVEVFRRSTELLMSLPFPRQKLETVSA